MTLYAADIMDLAKPVEKKPRKNTKKEKVLPTPEPSEPEVVPEPVAPEPIAEKQKREMTDKQKVALVKMQEARKRKKEEANLAKQQQENAAVSRKKEEEEKQQALLAKKEAAKEKRRIAAEKRKAEQTLSKEIEQEVTNLIKTPKAKKARVVRGDNPPGWFQKYIEGVKREQSHSTADKKPVKQIQQEAEQEAKSKWGNGLVRDRLQNEVDGHMNRMYGMIFGSRNMR
jgi:hypothetical protein